MSATSSLRLLSLLLLIFFIAGAARAEISPARSLADMRTDSLNASRKVVYLDGRPSDAAQRAAVEDSLAHEMLSFYYDQFRHFDDPAAPYFQFLSREANLMMGIGGAVRMRLWYDADGVVPSPGFAPYLIPIPHRATDRRDLGTTPAGTCLFFQIMGRNSFFGKYQLYIECDFNGYKARDFHLKKAYAMFRNFTVGLASSTFSDPAAQTPMVDANGPSNKIAPVNILVRYMPAITEHWVVGLSAEDPSSPANVADAEGTARVSRWTPDVAALAQYQWGRGEHVRLSGMWRLMQYRDLSRNRNCSVQGWGVLLSSVSHPAPMLTLYASGVCGRGFTSVMNDLLIGQYDLVGDPGRPGRMYSPGAYGWHLGVQYNFRPWLYSCLAAGQVRYLPRYAVNPDEYKYGQLLTANLFWNPTPRSMFGIEYDWGRRKNFDGSQGRAQRIGMVAQFSF